MRLPRRYGGDQHRREACAAGSSVPSEDRGLFSRLLAGNLLNDPDTFEREIARNRTIREVFANALEHPAAGAQEVLAGSHDAFRRLILGRRTAAGRPARTADVLDKKKALLDYILRKNTGTDLRLYREERFLEWAAELDDDDFAWLKNQLIIQGNMRPAALVALLIPYRPRPDDAARRKTPAALRAEEEVAYTSLRAAGSEPRPPPHPVEHHHALVPDAKPRDGRGGSDHEEGPCVGRTAISHSEDPTFEHVAPDKQPIPNLEAIVRLLEDPATYDAGLEAAARYPLIIVIRE